MGGFRTGRDVGDSICQAGGGEERNARFAFCGGFEAKHQLSPGGVAGNEVICFLLPAGVGETKQGWSFALMQRKEESCVLPLLAGLAEPFGF